MFYTARKIYFDLLSIVITFFLISHDAFNLECLNLSNMKGYYRKLMSAKLVSGEHIYYYNLVNFEKLVQYHRWAYLSHSHTRM